MSIRSFHSICGKMLMKTTFKSANDRFKIKNDMREVLFKFKQFINDICFCFFLRKNNSCKMTLRLPKNVNIRIINKMIVSTLHSKTSMCDKFALTILLLFLKLSIVELLLFHSTIILKEINKILR